MARLLITGAAGRIGTALRTGLATEHTSLRLTDRVSLGDAGPREELVQTDLGDREQVMSLCEGVAVINCANCWSAEVSETVGMKMPIRPLRRMTYYIDVQSDLEPLPLTRDANGISIRPEGSGYIVGVTNNSRSL